MAAGTVVGMHGREARVGIMGMATRRVRMDPWECEARVGAGVGAVGAV